MVRTMESQGADNHEQAPYLLGQDLWKDICVCLQEPEAILPIFHIPSS